ncbi:GNAT family N-acetyltransferase [Iodobacter fluviatilis]|uniref:Protease synthase and sporulation negative regulatory protein PAI 1 n=1 Tax=Iodobacter fluviatilis TaxID=537 RepID=A0A377SZ86_9NEIS|nr:GNAT family N-acetyltransferase [Iodobacter fluviatilis]TCU82996.1 ribosomal protein S18 acetylase RimI-like enzyme [Iodobacter fluviatilis]STR45819.1 Protease synthase and sporulation negative regulatory protein PAI 1 [Iodobacter fluviatilis]
MNHSLVSRPATAADAQNLAALAIQVWLHTYATSGIRQDISAYVLSAFTPDKFTTLINDPRYQLLITEINQHLVAYAQIDFASEDQPEFGSVELQTLYVQEAFTGQGLGSKLLAYCEEIIADRTYWLSSNSNNHRAIAFYARQGFVQHGVTYFEFGGNQYENKVLVKA